MRIYYAVSDLMYDYLNNFNNQCKLVKNLLILLIMIVSLNLRFHQVKCI